jgi:CheY-like chemotaxis protein
MAGVEVRPACVLIVDDDPDTRTMTAAALQDGYDVVCATTSREALRQVRARVPDAIVVDVMLGPESGWELIRVLQADRACRAVPIVVLSGSRVGLQIHTHLPAERLAA